MVGLVELLIVIVVGGHDGQSQEVRAGEAGVPLPQAGFGLPFADLQPVRGAGVIHPRQLEQSDDAPGVGGVPILRG